MTYNGFTITNLFADNPTGPFTVLEQNMQYDKVEVLGWFIGFGFPIWPRVINIHQLLYVKDGAETSLPQGFNLIGGKEVLLPAGVSTLNEEEHSTRVHADRVTITTDPDSYNNEVVSRGTLVHYDLRGLENNDGSTKLFFFSVDQLITANIIIKEYIDQGINPDIVFSGSLLDIGRMASPINTRELNQVENDRIAQVANQYSAEAQFDSQRLEKWFSLKMEIKTDGTLLDPSSAASDSSVMFPMAFFAHPCPPSWHTSISLFGILQLLTRENLLNIEYTDLENQYNNLNSLIGHLQKIYSQKSIDFKDYVKNQKRQIDNLEAKITEDQSKLKKMKRRLKTLKKSRK